MKQEIDGTKEKGTAIPSSHLTLLREKEEEEEEEKETLDKFGRRTSLSSANMISSDARGGSTNSLPVHTLPSPTKKNSKHGIYSNFPPSGKLGGGA